MSITVISTAYDAPTRHLCEGSVRAQTVMAEHVYVDASIQDPPRPASENLWLEVNELPPDEIVVWLDGDDWLLECDALEIVRDLHAGGALVTYGQYVTSDGVVGHCAPYDTTRPVRSQPWFASHLRTFRAGLFHQLAAADLQDERCRWLERCVDLAVMFPLIEMAGWDRVRFCASPLCVYNVATAWERTASRAELAREKELETMIRRRTPKGRLSWDR